MPLPLGKTLLLLPQTLGQIIQVCMAEEGSQGTNTQTKRACWASTQEDQLRCSIFSSVISAHS